MQIHILSEQLDQEFNTITHQHIKRKYNGRADQLAHAAGINKERGDHYARHPEDQSRPAGNKSKPSHKDIQETLIFRSHQILLPSRYVTYPIYSLLKPTKITINDKTKMHYQLKEVQHQKDVQIIKESALYEPHYKFEERQRNKEIRKAKQQSTQHVTTTYPQQNPQNEPITTPQRKRAVRFEQTGTNKIKIIIRPKLVPLDQSKQPQASLNTQTSNPQIRKRKAQSQPSVVRRARKRDRKKRSPRPQHSTPHESAKHETMRTRVRSLRPIGLRESIFDWTSTQRTKKKKRKYNPQGIYRDAKTALSEE